MKILKIKYSGGCLEMNLGCEKAPDILLEKGWREASGKKFDEEEIKINKSNVDDVMENIEKSNGDIFLGGDHSITYGCFRGFAKKFSNAGIVIFDAHPDCYPEEFVNHENWVYWLIKEGVLKKENTIFIGLRAIDAKEKMFLDKNKIKYFTMEQLFNNEENICDAVMEMAREFDGLYLSVDIDVLDPAFAPGTGYLEPGGMSSLELLYFLKRIRNLRNLKRVDLVEINPDKDINGVTVGAGQKILEIFV
ncbi:MAG: arginase family protein [Candidatus Woesearchaeota archaeon]